MLMHVPISLQPSFFLTSFQGTLKLGDVSDFVSLFILATSSKPLEPLIGGGSMLVPCFKELLFSEGLAKAPV